MSSAGSVMIRLLTVKKKLQVVLVAQVQPSAVRVEPQDELENVRVRQLVALQNCASPSTFRSVEGDL